jgi:lysyl-tRNA synthetase class 2
LEARARILAAVRHLFAAEEFVEVETPCLQVSPGMEPHIMALSAELNEPFAAGKRRLYLHTSPEFAMKKLLAAGVRRLYQIAHVWRDGERSPVHHPEFTMLEWYRAEASYGQVMDDCARLLAAAAKAAGVGRLSWAGRSCDPLAKPATVTVAAAFHRYCGIDLLATAPDPRSPDRALLAAAARGLGLYVGETDSWEDLFCRLMIEQIEPHLGDGVPLILCEYPLSLAALARPTPHDPRVAERFELYACGLELANGFGELTDAKEQRRRFAADMALKERLYGICYPIDEDFLAALEAGLPDCAGVALGIDRLVMLATGRQDIEDVLWAPVVK